MTTFKVYDKLLGNHVHVRLFVGPDKDHLALSGRLAFSLSEWADFENTFLRGGQLMRHRVLILSEHESEDPDAFVRPEVKNG